MGPRMLRTRTRSQKKKKSKLTQQLAISKDAEMTRTMELLDETLQKQILLFVVSTITCEDALLVRRCAASIMSVCRCWRDALRQQSRAWVVEKTVRPNYARSLVATTASQLNSLAERPTHIKWARYEEINLKDRSHYFAVSCRPITAKAEDDMELLSDLVSWGERFVDHWEPGIYACAQCSLALYSSAHKWGGPCCWPSWRTSLKKAISTADVQQYNNYTCAVREIYCSRCDLFIGHMFADARQRGDIHPSAKWRH